MVKNILNLVLITQDKCIEDRVSVTIGITLSDGHRQYTLFTSGWSLLSRDSFVLK